MLGKNFQLLIILKKFSQNNSAIFESEAEGKYLSILVSSASGGHIGQLCISTFSLPVHDAVFERVHLH